MSDQSFRVIDNPDGTMTFVPLTAEDIAASEARAAAERAAKGHDCWEHPVHKRFRTSRGGMQDAYYCGICHDLLQVG